MPRLPFGAKRQEGEVVSACEGDRQGARRKLKQKGVRNQRQFSV